MWQKKAVYHKLNGKALRIKTRTLDTSFLLSVSRYVLGTKVKGEMSPLPLRIYHFKEARLMYIHEAFIQCETV